MHAFLPSANEMANVMFSVVSVCLSVWPRVGVPEQGPAPSTQNPSLSPPDMFNNLVKPEPLCTPPPILKCVHHVACTVGKRTVGIQLKCLPVGSFFGGHKSFLWGH